MIPLLAIMATCECSDRRLDPFQFNLCVWDLEGLDPRIPTSTLGSASSYDEDMIAKTMYTSLSTCDMFILPGLRNRTTTRHLVETMAESSFTGFQVYPPDGLWDSSVLSRIDIGGHTALTNGTYPIANSTCNCSSGGTALMNLSFHANITFHAPVPRTHVASVRLKNGSSPCDCAWREAQAVMLCDMAGALDPADHLFVAGSFESSPTDPGYGAVLRGCGLRDVSSLGGHHPFSRQLRAHGNKSVLWDTIWVNDAVWKSGYLDTMVFFTDLDQIQSLALVDYTYPLTLFVRQPLTPRWKRFEIAFTLCVATSAIAYFIWLLIFSRPGKARDAVLDASLKDGLLQIPMQTQNYSSLDGHNPSPDF
jgi:hypothetical protein